MRVVRACIFIALMAILAVLLLLCAGCSQCSRNGIEISADERFYYRNHVSDPESEAKIKGVTNNTGPVPWFSLLTTRTANCYAFKEPAGPRYVFFTAPDGQPIHWNKPIIRYAFSPNVPPFARTAFASGFAQWNAALGNIFGFRESSTYNVMIYWDQNGAAFTDPGRAGFTSVQLNGDIIFSANVNINAKTFQYHSGEPRGISTEAINGRYPADIDAVALHEIGHVLGLDHSNLHPELIDPPGDVPTMNSVIAAGAEKLHPDDVAGIRKLYTNVVLMPPTDFENLKGSFGDVGGNPQDLSLIRAPRQIKGQATRAFSVGKAIFYFDSDGGYLGSFASGKFSPRK